METRYRIQNEIHFIEEEATEKGKARLIWIRNCFKEFKGKRIKSIIQAYPSKIKIDMWYRVTH